MDGYAEVDLPSSFCYLHHVVLVSSLRYVSVLLAKFERIIDNQMPFQL